MTEGRNKRGQDASPSQRDRFIETAKALGATEDDGALDRVLGKVAPTVRPKKTASDEPNGDP